MQTNDLIELTIDNLGSSGEGVGRSSGIPIFVDGALPGEQVRVKLSAVKKSYAKGNLLEILQPSPARRKAPCPYFGKCGGCQIMHLDYGHQLEMKRQRVKDALERIGKFKDITVSPCIPSPKEYRYRNKVQVPVTPEGIGFYAKRSHQVIPIEECLIHCDLGDRIYKEIKARVKKLIPYDEETGKGFLRHLLIRTAVHTGQVLVVFVTSGSASDELTDISVEILEKFPEVKGIIQNINTRRDNIILGREWRTLAGSDHIVENILGFSFKVSPASFFQVNPLQAEHLYAKAIELADLDASQTVLDAYCGVGTLSTLIAPHAKSVVGIECIPEAIEDAKINAKMNGISNTQFICGTVESKINDLPHIDTVILNPPRKGCEHSVLSSLLVKNPSSIVYVSCDPATLARDLAILCQGGYQIDTVHPFDLFPQTAHVETVVRCIKA